MNIFEQMSLRIIKEQQLIMGPVAWDEASKVSGFNILDKDKGEVSFSGDPKDIINRLVNQYARLFGKASNEVCKESVQDLIAEIPKDQIPENLK